MLGNSLEAYQKFFPQKNNNRDIPYLKFINITLCLDDAITRKYWVWSKIAFSQDKIKNTGL